MLPGKVYTPEDVLAIARKRMWLVLLPLAIVSAATSVYVHTLPSRYRASTTISVIPQGVPESFVRSTVVTKFEDRLQPMMQQILTRAKLEGIINEFNLYEDELKTGIMEDIVARMRNDYIHPQVLRSDAFQISFVGTDPRTVMNVTEKLGSLFIEENIQDRENQTLTTTDFLEDEVEKARRRLEEYEKKVEVYRRRHAGQLPTQLQSNLHVLQNAQSQVRDVADALIRERDRQLQLERDIAYLEQQIEESPQVAADGTPQNTPAEELDRLRAQLAVMRLTKVDEHPDVRKLKAAVEELEARVAAMPAQAGETPVSPDLVRLSAPEMLRQKRLDDMRLALQQVMRNIVAREEDQVKVRKVIADYQARNEAIPTRETELIELNREYDMISAHYKELVSKREQSRMATNLETRQIAERFHVTEPARMPERAFSPNRERLNLMGVALGLGIGVLLVALLEYRDRSFKTDEEVARLLTLPVLAVVPLMQSGAEKRRGSRTRLLMNVGLGTAVLGCMAVVAYTLAR